MKRVFGINSIVALLLALSLLLSACSFLPGGNGPKSPVSLDDIPKYSGRAYVEINGNIPFFTEDEITTEDFESYSELDALGRCGVAFACLGESLMPPEEEDRESLSSVTPSGWEYDGKSNNNKYDFVDGTYVYNRCHLIGYQLAGENANKKNLVTGTRYLNIEGMLPFENLVDDYIEETGNHVMYRVTPIYSGYNLVCDGVLMEGLSVEDSGEDICFCIYAYNVEPGVTINYFTGQNYLSSEAPEINNPGGETGKDEPETPGNENPDEDDSEWDDDILEGGESITYVVTTSGKYHLPTCRYAESTKEENKTSFTGTLAELLLEYPSHQACKTCLKEE